jgi:hypothetical protein
MSKAKKIFVVVAVMIVSVILLTACGADARVDDLIGQIELLQQELDEIRRLGGVDGLDGKDGRDGRDGIDGKDGVGGKDGTNGRDGKDGTSCDCVCCTATDEPKIYRMGDTITVFNNGIRLFEMTYVEYVDAGVGGFVHFDFTNFHLPVNRFNDAIKARVFTVEENEWKLGPNHGGGAFVSSQFIPINETVRVSIDHADGTWDYVYLSFNVAGFIPFAIIKI